VVHFRRTSSLIERIAPRLAVGRGPRNQPSREQLEREAQAEIQARIDLGRPGPDEFDRTRPVPDWLLLRQPPSTRRLDLLEVNLNAVVPPVPAEVLMPGMPGMPGRPEGGRPGRQEGAGSGRRSDAGSAG